MASGMAFRIQALTLSECSFEGTLDREALSILRARLGPDLRAVLLRGTTVDPDCWDDLRALGPRVRAESEYLTRLLHP